MLRNFSLYISEEKLIKKGDSVLLSVSGGVDSMVMCHLFIQSGFDVSIAHIDHHTRNGESSEDAVFVKEYAIANRIPYYQSDYHYDDLSNFQAEARNHRYRFLERIRSEKGLTKIATAHHKNDIAESVLMNITRGCGLDGLSGISAHSGAVIRPLLFTDKNSLLAYASKENIKFREDKSNDEVKYRRNAMRHQVIPRLEQINKSSVNNISRTSNNIQDELDLMNALIEKQKSTFILRQDEDIYMLNLKAIKDFPGSLSLLKHLCNPYAFNGDQLANMLLAETGSQFLSAPYKATINRDQLIIQSNNDVLPLKIEIADLGVYKIDDHRIIKIKEVNLSDVDFQSSIQYLDIALLSFPLHLRSWQHEDVFCPLGMNGHHQKIQDFFVNNKFSSLDKENTLLLISNGHIVAILGHRIDDRYKITSDSKSALSMTLISDQD